MASIIDYNRTIATLFFVRPLGLCAKHESLNPKDKQAAKIIKSYGFIEAYMYHEDRVYGNHLAIFCLFKPPNLQEFNDFIISEQEDGAVILDEYDLENGYVVLVYKFPDIYSIDYEMILAGKYSKTSKAFKSIFPLIKNTNEITIYSIVLHKIAQGVKVLEEEYGVTFGPDDEVWHMPDIQKETLTQDKLAKL